MNGKFLNCNRLWKVWYGIVVVIIQLYVTSCAIRQYVDFKGQFYNPRFGGLWDIIPLHIYISFIITSLSFMCFFIYFCLVNVQQSVINTFSLMQMNVQEIANSIVKGVMALMRERFPFSPVFHILMATFLLLPMPIVEMEQIRNEAVAPDRVWTVDVYYFTHYFTWPTRESLHDNPALINMHYLPKPETVSVEFLNVIIASIFLTIKMPMEFWKSNKSFSLIFSFLVFFSCFSWIIIFEAGSIFIKYSANGDQSLIPFNFMSYHAVIALIGSHFFLIVMGFVAVFDYGITKTVTSWFVSFKCYVLRDSGAKMKNACCINSILFLGFFLTALILVVDLIIFVQFFHFYQAYSVKLFLLAIISGSVNLLIWFLVWFTFCIRGNWDFKFEINGILSDSNSYGQTESKLMRSPETLYGCFHNNIAMSSTSSHSSGPGPLHGMEYICSENAGMLNNYQNYVYLQSPTNQIPTISESFDESVDSDSKSSSVVAKTVAIKGEHGNSISRTNVSMSDDGINKLNDSINSDSYRSLQMLNSRKNSKLVSFQELANEIPPDFNAYNQRFSTKSPDLDDPTKFLKVPDILNLQRSHTNYQSDSSLDQISSSVSSKLADQVDGALCSEV